MINNTGYSPSMICGISVEIAALKFEVQMLSLPLLMVPEPCTVTVRKTSLILISHKSKKTVTLFWMTCDCTMLRVAPVI